MAARNALFSRNFLRQTGAAKASIRCNRIARQRRQFLTPAIKFFRIRPAGECRAAFRTRFNPRVSAFRPSPLASVLMQDMRNQLRSINNAQTRPAEIRRIDRVNASALHGIKLRMFGGERARLLCRGFQAEATRHHDDDFRISADHILDTHAHGILPFPPERIKPASNLNLLWNPVPAAVNRIDPFGTKYRSSRHSFDALSNRAQSSLVTSNQLLSERCPSRKSRETSQIVMNVCNRVRRHPEDLGRNFQRVKRAGDFIAGWRAYLTKI